MAVIVTVSVADTSGGSYVQVLDTVTGIVAKVAVVMLVVHELELPLIIEFTRP